MVQNLCTHYSPPLLSLPHPFNDTEMLPYHPFPSPSALATAGVGLHLRSLGFGYRSDYIHRTAQMLVGRPGTGPLQSPHEVLEPSELWLRQLRKSTTTEAREELLKFVGVGRKVADCILLMSLDKVCVIFSKDNNFFDIHLNSNRRKLSPLIPTFIRSPLSIME